MNINMSDYSFMKSGIGNPNETTSSIANIDVENIEILLSLFITNAISTASKYVTYCNRNGVSKIDIQYALKYEVFEFLNRNTLMTDIKEATEDYNRYIDETAAEAGDEDEENPTVGQLLDADEDESVFIIPDSELNEFKRIDEDLIYDANKEFIETIHKHNDNWDSWEPQTPLDMILKSAIDKTNL
jgi:hypothetical protein